MSIERFDLEPEDLEFEAIDVYGECPNGKESPDISCKGCLYLRKKERKTLQSIYESGGFDEDPIVIITLFCNFLGSTRIYRKGLV